MEPPESLKKMLFPFIESEMENIVSAVDRDKKARPTAVCTLRLWLAFRSIILQDAAAMCLKSPSRKSHTFFKLPIFQSAAFLVSCLCLVVLFATVTNTTSLLLLQSYVELMRSKLATFENGREMSLESCMPEVQRQINQLHGEVKNSNVTNVEGFARLNNRFDEMESSRGELATGLVELGQRMGGRTTVARGVVSTGGGREVEDEVVDDVDFGLAKVYLIRMRDIDCVDDIYKEFKGIGAPCQDQPIIGGLEECDRRWKTKWRRHFNAADQKRFSRMTMLARAIDDQVEDGRLLPEVLGSFDHYFLQKKRSFCGLISLLQAEGFIEKKAPRTKRVRRESPGEGGGGG